MNRIWLLYIKTKSPLAGFLFRGALEIFVLYISFFRVIGRAAGPSPPTLAGPFPVPGRYYKALMPHHAACVWQQTTPCGCLPLRLHIRRCVNNGSTEQSSDTMIQQMTVVVDLTRSEEEMSLKPG